MKDNDKRTCMLELILTSLDDSPGFKERLFMSAPTKEVNNHMQRTHPML